LLILSHTNCPDYYSHIIPALIANELRAEAMQHLTGDAVQTVVNSSIELAKEWLLQQDSTLSARQAEALAATAVLGTLMVTGAASDLKAYAPAVIRSISRGKVPSAQSSHIHLSDNKGADGTRVNTHIPQPTKLVVEEKKLDYLFGKVTSSKHNEQRSLQNLRQFERIGIFDTVEGRQIIRESLDKVVKDSSNITGVYTKNIEGNLIKYFETRESILSGPQGLIKLESTFEIMRDGVRRLITIIPKGGN
jgi:hypothetical protein